MNPQSQAILSRAELPDAEFNSIDQFCAGLQSESARLLPIIRELLLLVEKQREALDHYGSKLASTGGAARESIAHTDKVLKELGNE